MYSSGTLLVRGVRLKPGQARICGRRSPFVGRPCQQRGSPQQYTLPTSRNALVGDSH